MASIEQIKGSDGTANASLATVQNSRSSGASTIIVDTVAGINPAGFIGSMGTPHTFTDPVTSETITVISEATAVDFSGHIDGSNIEIDDIAPGYTDLGSEVGDIIIIKPTTQYSDNLAEVLEAAHNDDGTPSPAGIHYSMPAGALLPYAGAAAPTGFLLCDGSSKLRATYTDLFTAIGTVFGAADGTHFNVPDLRGRLPFGAGARTFTITAASTDVNIGTDQIAVTASDNIKTGKAVVLTTSGGAPAGLTAGNTYYLIVIDTTHIKLATTHALAVAGTGIDITTQGTGTHTLTFTGTTHALGSSGGEDNHSTTISEMPAHVHTGGAVNTGQSATGPGPLGGYTNVADVASTGGSTAHNVLNPYTAVNYIIKT